MKLKECFDNIISGEWGEECLVGEKGTKILRTTNFTDIGKIDYRDVVERKISDAKIDKKRLKYGDIILEKSGGTDKTPVGRVVFCDHNIETDIYLCNNFTVGLRTNTTCIAKYLFYLLFFNHQQGKTLALQNKTTGIRNLKVDSYLNCKISLPSIDDQKRIADELDKVSELIEKRQQQLDQSDLLIKSRFVEVFGAIEDNTYRKSSFGEEFIVASGGTPSTQNSEYWENGEISWIGSNLCQNNIIYESDGKFITELGLKHSSAKVFDKNTILIALVGATIGKAALLKFETAINQNIAGIVIKDNKRFSPYYVFYYAMALYPAFMKLGGDKFKMANLTFIRQLPILLPPIELQNQFADFVEKVEQNKAKIKTSLSELNTLKKALMQKYFG